MKKLIGFLALAFVFLFSLTSIAKSTVQKSLDKNVFVVSKIETVIYQTVTPLVLSESLLVRETQTANFNYNFENYKTTAAKIDNHKPIVNLYEIFVPNQDVIWLTNMKSK